MDVGLVSLGDNLPHPHTGERLSPQARFRQLVDLGAHAQELGFWSFHLGEHHFSEYILSSPTPILAAVAERTTSLRLSTAVSLLPHHDAVRLAEDYATVDVLSGGRAELVGATRCLPRPLRAVRPGPGALRRDARGVRRALAAPVDRRGRHLVRRFPTPAGRRHGPSPGRSSSPTHPSGSPPAPPSPSTAPSRSAAPSSFPPCRSASAPRPGLIERYREGWRHAGRDPEEGRVALHVHCHVGAGATADAVESWRPFQTGYLSWVLRGHRGRGGPPSSALRRPGYARGAGRLRKCR